MTKLSPVQKEVSGNHSLFFSVSVSDLSEELVARFTEGNLFHDARAYLQIVPKLLEINQGIFGNPQSLMSFPDVTVIQQPGQLYLSCSCQTKGNLLCEHQSLVLNAIIRKDEFRIFLDKELRQNILKKFAVAYGLEDTSDLDEHFTIAYVHKKLEIKPRRSSLMPVTPESLHSLNNIIVPDLSPDIKSSRDVAQVTIVVLKQHKYYQYLFIELYRSQISKEGKIKNPLSQIDPLDLIWDTEDAAQIKFYTGISKFQNHLNAKRCEADITALKAIVRNPFNYEVYYHRSEVSDNITANSVEPVKVKNLPKGFELSVKQTDHFYEIGGNLRINGVNYPLADLAIVFTYFVRFKDTLYLVDNLQVLLIIELLIRKQGKLLVHQSKFEEFRKQWLSKLEDKISIEYQHIKSASAAQLKKEGFLNETERIIYLSDFGSQVMIIPVLRYGEVEIPIRTKRQIYSKDARGRQFLVQRNPEEENSLTALLIKQHPYFEEQLEENDLYYFYLHKRRFLEEEWFLKVFEDWTNSKITVLGFNELEDNKLNPHKVKINIKVLSGINWFNAVVNARYGNRRASLKQIYRAVKNKSRYVKLDDGTMGILPEEWIEKFNNYFNSGEIVSDDTLQIAKNNFTAIEQLYDAEQLDEGVKDEINLYRWKLTGFDSAKPIEIPKELNASLRPYQIEGLNWLNFLDDLNFGGCLADDMGLGKSIQVIAFILSQRKKVDHNTNLLVVPTSLIFNWKQEVEKFAPSIRILTIHGVDRIKDSKDFDQYEIILTSYGTLLSDISFLKDYEFNYVFLDESQNIKNPESQRYKAARLLKSRNKITITGTPVENNTFDMYSQLSFACPGLLGSKQYFKEIYSAPIDMFKNSKRALELQNKISPFILRRTKQQVASELPEKTEIVLYCEMQKEQRSIYDAYEKEFRDFISATDGDLLKKSSMHVLKGLTRLRQVCNSPLLIEGEKPPGSASSKIAMLLEQIESKEAHHKILVFSQFVGMLDLIKKELVSRNIKHTYLTGQTRNREAVVEEFQNNPEVRVFLISLKAGGTGLNLTEADYVYLVDPWWNPAVENQAIDRCHRIGQDKHIVAVRMICPGTVEEKIMQMQESKKQLVNELMPGDSLIKSFSRQNLLSLLSSAKPD